MKHRVAAFALLVAACQAPEHVRERVDASPAALTVAPGDERTAAAIAIESTSTTGSPLQLARIAGRKVALVADEDARAVRVVDGESLEELSHLALDGRPSALVVAGDGRAYVALRDRAEVVALEAKDGIVLAKSDALRVPNEPVGLATTPDGQRLLVTSAWGARLTAIEVASRAYTLDVALPREPRGLAVSRDGSAAFVAHAVGSRVSRVSLAAGPDAGKVSELALGGTDFTPVPRRRSICIRPPIPHRRPPLVEDPFQGNAMFRFGDGDHRAHERDAVQGFAVAMLEDRAFVPHVLAHRGEVTVGGYGTSESYPSHQPALAAVDTTGGEVWLRVANQSVRADKSRYGHAGGNRRDACFLPRAAAADAHSGTVLVGCEGTDSVEVYDGSNEALVPSMKARWKVPAGPTGIAVDEAAGTALVWSQFDRALSVIELAKPTDPKEVEKRKQAQLAAGDVFSLPSVPKRREPLRVVKLAALAEEIPTLSPQALAGRRLFHGAGDARISVDGRACASCHPDGREDGLTWPTPFGARQTPMLAGRLDDAVGPYGWHGDATTVEAHLKQTFSRLGGRGLTGDDLDALIAYCREMPTPPVAPAEDPAVVRGKELFFADTVGCATCHKQGGGSDGSRHAVGSGADLDTPSLRFVSGTAPYFHDGRYATLSELLEATQGKMGWANGMSPEDLTALEAYVRTL
jgi:DNA-binding beta-propeller fold protein YncE/mono/diheme cytochrome c family protein